MRQQGIYVERRIAAPVERVWELTQDPALHQRWDLRFTAITYLPRASDDEPQRFLYETRIGFGLAVRGTGESVATRRDEAGEGVSSLRFGSDSRISLIREGAGYWRYVPLGAGETRFLTWYDYEVRFGWAGAALDRMVFRPAMGWATAWSFDRLALWAEEGTAPEVWLRLTTVHALARVAIALVWLWHGLVPKLVFGDADEMRMLLEGGLGAEWLPWFGGAEVLMALLVLGTWRWRGMLPVQAGLMAAALLGVALRSPEYLTRAFNPVTLNGLVMAVAVMGWVAAKQLPTARRCLRVRPGFGEGQ